MRTTFPPIGVSRPRLLLGAVMALAVVMTAVQPALADGVVIPDPPPWPEPPPLRETWLTIRYHRVSVSIDSQVAVTRVEQEFVNEHDWEAEGTYVFPLPEGASVSEFTMWVGGKPVEGEILPADEARRIYEDIVRRRRDPALLEYVGRQAVKARIFPIPPGGSRKIELEYTQVLPVDSGLVRYDYPLNTEKFSTRPLEEVSIHVDIRSDDAMHAIYSPTHQDRLFIERDGDFRATAGYEETDVLPDQDFELVYTVSQEDVGLNLMTYRESPNSGFFLLLAAPTVEVGRERVIPRDVVLVLDTSGSMEGAKLTQAKNALVYVLEHLNEEDRFSVIAFSTGLAQYASGLRPAAESLRAAEWVAELEAMGGTNINRALLEAILSSTGDKASEVDSGRPIVLIFLTDGLPTEGVTEVDQILANVEAAAPGNVRLFPFGVGDDVNTVLLDTLAEQNRGATGYVRPDERIDEEVSAFFAKIRTPVLTDIELDFGEVVAEDTYPYPLPDLFAGSQLIVTGRYRLPSLHAGGESITLSGRVDGDRREFVLVDAFAARDQEDPSTGPTASFIPRLWATRKIGHLLTQIRLHGEKKEWVDAVVSLSVRYGIVTPYTSFLITDEDILTEAGREKAVRNFMARPAPDASGAPAVEMAEQEAQLRGADSAAPSTGTAGDRVPEEALRAVRRVGSKTFVLEDGVWIDTSFNADSMRTEQLPFGSQAYFEVLAARPGWGDYLALGDRVIFVARAVGSPGVETEEVAYEVVESEEAWVPVESTETPGFSTPTAEPTQPEQPAATPSAGAESDSSAPSGLCPGAMAMLAAALAASVVWGRRSR